MPSEVSQETVTISEILRAFQEFKQQAIAEERETIAKMLEPAYPHLAAAVRARGKA